MGFSRVEARGALSVRDCVVGWWVIAVGEWWRNGERRSKEEGYLGKRRKFER